MATHVKSFDLVGKVEAVDDVISLIKPTDTPFLSSIKSESITNTLYQWMEDDLRAVAKNARVEGADFTDSNRDQPQMRSNGTQILEETFKLSRTSQSIKLHGRASAVDRETFKTGKLVKMDLEHSLVGTAQTYVAATTTVAGEFAGVQAQIHADNTLKKALSTDPNRALTEDLINDAMEKLEAAGAEAGTLMVRPNLTRTIAGFQQASGRTLQQDASSKKVTRVVNVYEGPLGTVRVVKNRRIRTIDALVYDSANWKLQVLDNWQREKLAKIGDADRWSIVGEFGLKHNNQRASALITDLL